MNKKMIRILAVALLLIYVISPIDLCPGLLVDDIIAVLIYMAVNKRSSEIKKLANDIEAIEIRRKNMYNV